MSEAKPELKSGDALDFKVGDKTLTIAPVPWGNIRKIMRIAFDAQKDIAAGKLSGIPELVDKNLFQMFPLLFAPGSCPFLTVDWMENNLTVPLMRHIMDAAVVVNGLQDFFDKATGKTLAPASPSIPATPSAKDGSTTSAASPTDGDRATATS